MIEINLVPESLRKKRKSKALLGRNVVLPREAVVGLVGGAVVVLLLVHVLLQFLISVKFVQHKDYKSQSEKMAAQKTNVDAVVQELKRLQGKYKSAGKIAGDKNISWARKLNELSDSLPRGVWMSRITLDGDTLLIQGSAVSKNKTEMINVHNFTSNLKADQVFMTSFSNLELGLIKSRTINQTPIADFTIRADIKY